MSGDHYSGDQFVSEYNYGPADPVYTPEASLTGEAYYSAGVRGHVCDMRCRTGCTRGVRESNPAMRTLTVEQRADIIEHQRCDRDPYARQAAAWAAAKQHVAVPDAMRTVQTTQSSQSTQATQSGTAGGAQDDSNPVLISIDDCNVVINKNFVIVMLFVLIVWLCMRANAVVSGGGAPSRMFADPTQA